ncbi:MAG: VOC family protein [Ilumatobacteraceae bacterium]
MARYTPVSAAEFAALELGDWRYVLGGIEGRFRAPSFCAAGALVGVIAAAADAADHHPDLDLHYPGVVRVRLSTHAIGGLSNEDVAFAQRVSQLAAAAGATPVSTDTVSALEIALDTMDAERIRPFWAAVLGYREAGGNLVDPNHVGPPMWFQSMEEPRTERNRFHLDISVPHDVAEARVAAAIAAGGHLVDDSHARSWWVLADADGNEACISTWQDR